MELRHLRYFIAAARLEHFGRAANQLRIGRPALADVIEELETEIGLQLFTRESDRDQLTAAGRVLSMRLQGVLKSLDKAIASARRVGEGASGILTVGYAPLAFQHRQFTATIRRFKEDFPDVRLALLELSASEQVKALSSGVIQAGFMHFTQSSARRRGGPSDAATIQQAAGTDWISLKAGDLAVLVPTDHPLARRSGVQLSDLASERLVLVKRRAGNPSLDLFEEMCQHAGFTPEISHEADTIALQLHLVSVRLGIGVAIAAPDANFPPDVTAVPLLDAAHGADFAFGWATGSNNAVLEHLINIVRAIARAS